MKLNTNYGPGDRETWGDTSDDPRSPDFDGGFDGVFDDEKEIEASWRGIDL